MMMTYVYVNGIEMAEHSRGEGMPLLFVHGFPLDHRMWDGQCEVLSQSYRVIAPDLRGFGRSKSADEKVTMQQFADDLAILLDALGVSEPVVLCGLSMGGYVAFEFARRHNDRLRGLVLCDTHPRADSAEKAADRLNTAERVLRENTDFLAAEMVPKLLSPVTREKKPHVVEKVHDMIVENPRNGVAAALRGMAEREEASAWLDQITCPCQVIVGEEDGITPPEVMRELADRLSDCRFAAISEAGHLAPMEQPRAVNKVIAEFVARLP